MASNALIASSIELLVQALGKTKDMVDPSDEKLLVSIINIEEVMYELQKLVRPSEASTSTVAADEDINSKLKFARLRLRMAAQKAALNQ
jgi:hypothetical protein